MSLIAKGCRDSQAGRRRFEPGLPLQLFLGLRISPLSHLTLFTSKTRIGCCFFQSQRFFEGCDRLLFGFQVGHCVRVEANADGMSPLARCGLRIDAFFVAHCPGFSA